jgi:hypothetical protein
MVLHVYSSIAVDGTSQLRLTRLGVSICIRPDDKVWEPFRGSEIVSKLTEGPKTRIEAFRVEP